MRCGCRGGNRFPLGAALLTLACAETAPEAQPRLGAIPSEKPREHSALIDGASAWPRAGPPFASSSHGSGDFTIDIRISPPHLAAFQGLMLGQSVPVGTAAVAFHTRGGTAESSYGMQKQANGWFFVVADSEGRILEQGGLPLCAQCHEEAPADSLFVPSASRLPGPRVADGGP